MSNNGEGCLVSGGIFYVLLWIFYAVAWIVNLIQGIGILTDYEPERFGELIIKLIGMVIPFAAMITVWF